MKAIRHLIIFLALITVLISCEKEKTNTLLLSTEEVEFPAEGGESAFTIRTDADSWTIGSKSKDWLSISSTSGSQNEVQISLRIQSKTLKPRKDTLIINAGNADPARLIVSQASSEYLYDLSVDKTDMNFDFLANSVPLIVSSNSPEWNLSTEADWIQCDQKKGFNATRKKEHKEPQR